MAMRSVVSAGRCLQYSRLIVVLRKRTKAEHGPLALSGLYTPSSLIQVEVVEVSSSRDESYRYLMRDDLPNCLFRA